MTGPRTQTSFVDLVEQILQDTGNATWLATEILLYLPDALRTVTNYRPRIYKAPFDLESRYGTCNADTASKLTDTTKSQFTSSDVGKWVYNVDTRGWAQVTAYDSADVLSLDRDAFPDGNEAYRIFNNGCTDSKEINISSILSLIEGGMGGITQIEYPTLEDPPNFVGWHEQERNIIRLDLSFEPPNTDPTLTKPADKTAWLYLKMQHILSYLTSSAGAIDNGAGYSAGDSTIHIDGLSGNGTLEAGITFSITGLRGTYIVKADATIASNEGDITIFPALEADVADDAVITFDINTLPYDSEEIMAELVAGKCLMYKAPYFLNKSNTGGAKVVDQFFSLGQNLYALALAKLSGKRKSRYNTKLSMD